jgi:hypothetical protein
MVETGMAHFGERGQYGVLNTDDLAHILLWAVRGALLEDPSLSYPLRQTIRRLQPLITTQNQIMLAEVMKAKWPELSKDLSKELD